MQTKCKQKFLAVCWSYHTFAKTQLLTNKQLQHEKTLFYPFCFDYVL